MLLALTATVREWCAGIASASAKPPCDAVGSHGVRAWPRRHPPRTGGQLFPQLCGAYGLGYKLAEAVLGHCFVLVARSAT